MGQARDAVRRFIRRWMYHKAVYPGSAPLGEDYRRETMNKVNQLTLRPATLAAFVLFALLAGAQQQAPPLKVTKIKDNVYWAQGGVGSNDGIIVGSAGVIVVDTKTTADSDNEGIVELPKFIS